MHAEHIHAACDRLIKIARAPALMAARISTSSWWAAAPSIRPGTINSQLSPLVTFVISIIGLRGHAIIGAALGKGQSYFGGPGIRLNGTIVLILVLVLGCS